MQYALYFATFSTVETSDFSLESDSYKKMRYIHSNYEIMYIFEGQGFMYLANECYAIRPGTLLIIPAGKYHRSFYRPGEASGRFRIRFFPKELTEEAQTALLNLKPVYHVEGTPMVDFFSVKNNLFLGVETATKPYADGVCQVILFLRDYGEDLQSDNRGNSELARVKEYIENHSEKIRTVYDLAKQVNMSVSTLQKLFRTYLKTSPADYIRMQKCLKASMLIVNGVPAIDAAEMCGFEHYSTFYRAYQKVLHHAPSEDQLY